jgi:2-keto-4-pentenoate hydratase/2-oxohepta-3-ene-1,7-dioic acid hydratase in catechol pathway
VAADAQRVGRLRGELGVVIGTPAKDVAADNALDHVWGYTVVNDITARDIQFSEAQWSRCKSFDGFTPNGPFVVTADEIADPQDLHIWAVVDGQTVQDASTGQMIRSVATLIAHLSQSATLLPGTLISTGSPGGADILATRRSSCATARRDRGHRRHRRAHHTAAFWTERTTPR